MPYSGIRARTGRTSSAAAAAAMTGDLPGVVERARRGDADAFDVLVARFQDMAVGYAAALLGGRFHDAQDAAQQAFVEAYTTLADLRHPAAFPAWLRLLVRKHCDRLTRAPAACAAAAALPLDSIAGLPGGGDPATALARRETREAVRAAVCALPDAERAAVLLFYLGGKSLAQVAGFLGVPISTVRGRLYTGRRRLQERMIEQMSETLESERPSRDDAFRAVVRKKTWSAYHYLSPRPGEEPAADDLSRSRDALLASAPGDPVDFGAVQRCMKSLLYAGRHNEAAEVVAWYHGRRGALPLAEEAWCRWWLLSLRGGGGAGEEFVREHQEFVRWVSSDTVRSRLLLSADEHAPMSERGGDAMDPDGLPLWALQTNGAANNYRNSGHFARWLETAREVLAATPQTRATRSGRAFLLGEMASLLAAEGRRNEAADVALSLEPLSEEPDADGRSPVWRITALQTAAGVYTVLRDRPLKKDLPKMRTLLEQALARLDEWAPGVRPDDEGRQRDLASLRNECARLLLQVGDHQRAAALFRQVIASGYAFAGAYFYGAAALWAATGDRTAVLPLLRESARQVGGEGLGRELARCPEFATVRDDPEFLAALTPPNA
uniref:RNA polymerase sigma factor 70 region 4 type 2 domain-containing protein n=1 Tax=uncultured Armatimonadetes bacterium TaxID=157466 RepID=A0A6J4K5J2_9BACT|nr:hypothetical protein AVDCRST_MAG63-4815 [uncultured Armatimonadetes bacterium]